MPFKAPITYKVFHGCPVSHDMDYFNQCLDLTIINKFMCAETLPVIQIKASSCAPSEHLIKFALLNLLNNLRTMLPAMATDSKDMLPAEKAIEINPDKKTEGGWLSTLTTFRQFLQPSQPQL